ncbi:MAG: hypothetical protein ACRC8S_06890 [Fimbriiglobus sp.]
MSAWFTVYSTQSLQHITPADVAAYLRGPKVDFDILAETFGIEDKAVVERAVEALRVETVAGQLGEWFEVRYRPAKYRPLVVYLWSDPARVQTELAETEENYLAGRRDRGVNQVRTVLKGVTAVAAVELGGSQLEDMGLVIAGQVAEYLAGVADGVIRDTGDEWWAVHRGVPKLLAGSG